MRENKNSCFPIFSFPQLDIAKLGEILMLLCRFSFMLSRQLLFYAYPIFLQKLFKMIETIHVGWFLYRLMQRSLLNSYHLTQEWKKLTIQDFLVTLVTLCIILRYSLEIFYNLKMRIRRKSKVVLCPSFLGKRCRFCSEFLDRIPNSLEGHCWYRKIF